MIERFGPLAALAAALLTTACPAPDPAPGETEGETETEGSTDTGGSTGAEASTTEATGVFTVGGSGSSDGGASSSDGADESSTGEPGSAPSLEEVCEAFCDLATECFPEEPPPPGCVELCVEDGTEVETAECGEAVTAFYACLADLTCEQLESPERSCLEEESAIDELCGEGECIIGVGGGETECGFSEICPDYELEMSCDTETCICLEDGIEVGSCDAMGICEEGFGEIPAYAELCCGFV